MKSKLLVLLALTFSLGGCSFSSSSSYINNKDIEIDDEKDNDDEKQQDDDKQDDDSGKTTTGLSLDVWQEFEFHNEHKPQYNTSWPFYYGTSFEPRGCLWENPNEAVDYSGIEFSDKKQYMESPSFSNYVKVEVRFQFWFSSHQSTKYKATKGEPQFRIEEFDKDNKQVGNDSLEIVKSDIHSNNTPTEMKLYITNQKMTSFTIKFNNFIANGDSGYTPILCKISLKGWNYI